MNKKVGRNDPCSCGSGKKYKKCCESKHKHKTFEAKMLSSSALPSSLFSQSQGSATFFKKKVVQPLTPTEPPAEQPAETPAAPPTEPSEESVEVAEEKSEEVAPAAEQADPTVGHEDERITDL